jgi:hypothetical protein
MNIQDFISRYSNHPVLFMGAGISLRYLQNAYTWDGLLSHISKELKGNTEFYLDIKSQCEFEGDYKFDKIASLLEKEFNNDLKADRDGKFKEVNDIFYEKMALNVNLSRIKIYISQLLSSTEIKEEMKGEISELKKVRKNIGSIITTNYDKFIEEIFGFEPLIGNDILLSNPYGSVYKIHGCVSQPLKVIITEKDYLQFNVKYELIRAQLLSIFIHNPIIFMGYGIGDENIKGLLKTIFTYVQPNSEDAEKIRNNFLLVEHHAGSESHEICEHDIDIDGFSTIRINKIKTDDFKEIYTALSNLILPVSAMDVRKVQNIVKDMYAGGNIKVNITENLDTLDNSDRIIAIGSNKTINYQYHTSSETIADYFDIIDEHNSQRLTLIDKYSIQNNQFFPIFGFNQICEDILCSETLKAQQTERVNSVSSNVPPACRAVHTSIQAVLDDERITTSYKINAMLWGIMNDNIPLENAELYLRVMADKNATDFRKLLCAYDIKKHGD